MEEQRPFIYLYDMPKCIVTSDMIADLIKMKTGHKLTAPVQFKAQKNDPKTRLPSPLIDGIIMVDLAVLQKVAKDIKYFELSDGHNNVWPCRAIPYDKDLVDSKSRIAFLRKNIFLTKIPKEWTAKDIEEKFSVIGPVKSAKVSLSPVIK
jgi:hypothetical protein